MRDGSELSGGACLPWPARMSARVQPLRVVRLDWQRVLPCNMVREQTEPPPLDLRSPLQYVRRCHGRNLPWDETNGFDSFRAR